MDSPISAPSSVRRRTNTKPANLLICSNLVYRDLSIRDLRILCAQTGLEKTEMLDLLTRNKMTNKFWYF